MVGRAKLVALLLGLALPAPLRAQTRCLGAERSARDLLADSTLSELPPPTGTVSALAARPLLHAMDAQVRALRRAPSLGGTSTAVCAASRAMVTQHLLPTERLFHRVVALRDAAATVEALVLRAQAHELLADRWEQLAAYLVTLEGRSPAATRRTRRALALLHGVAASDDAPRRIGPRRDPPPESPPPPGLSTSAMIDQESAAHRLVAVTLDALAVHLARQRQITAAAVDRALDRLHDEPNRPLWASALDRAGQPWLWRSELAVPSAGELYVEHTTRYAPGLAP